MSNLFSRTLSASLLNVFKTPNSTMSQVVGSIFKGENSNIEANLKGKLGQVHLVGAGPGDAELITLKAYRLFQHADVVMVDWLVNPEILSLFPGRCERVFVGKKCGRHSMSQQQICDLLVDYAMAGKTVIRLKGGDPAIFARVAEECDALTTNNIPYTIVPGITSASGASAYAGIPLTHRECAQSVRFITAHLRDASQQPDWHKLVAGQQDQNGETLVFYMGFKRLSMICDKLVKAGMTPSMPVAVIQQATTSEQKLCIGTLEDISSQVELARMDGPAIIIVGEVVNKRNAVDAKLLSFNDSLYHL